MGKGQIKSVLCLSEWSAFLLVDRIKHDRCELSNLPRELNFFCLFWSLFSEFLCIQNNSKRSFLKQSILTHVLKFRRWMCLILSGLLVTESENSQNLTLHSFFAPHLVPWLSRLKSNLFGLVQRMILK